MVNEVIMKRLHQGCGESLQSNLPGIFGKRTQLPVSTDDQPKTPFRMRSRRTHRHNESDCG